MSQPKWKGYDGPTKDIAPSSCRHFELTINLNITIVGVFYIFLPFTVESMKEVGSDKTQKNDMEMVSWLKNTPSSRDIQKCSITCLQIGQTLRVMLEYFESCTSHLSMTICAVTLTFCNSSQAPSPTQPKISISDSSPTSFICSVLLCRMKGKWFDSFWQSYQSLSLTFVSHFLSVGKPNWLSVCLGINPTPSHYHFARLWKNSEKFNKNIFELKFFFNVFVWYCVWKMMDGDDWKISDTKDR